MKSQAILYAALLIGLAWVADASLHAWVFRTETFWHALVFNLTLDELHTRAIYASAIFLSAWLVGRCLGRRRAAEEQARALNLKLQAEHTALQQSQIRFQNIVSNIPGAIYQFTLKPDGTRSFPFVSEKSWDLIALNPQTIYAHPELVFELVDPEDQSAFDASIQESARTLQTWNWEGRFHVQGRVRWLKGVAQPEPQADGVIHWDGLMMDVTEQRQVADALRESETRYRTLMESAPEMIYVIGRDGRVLYLNAEAARKFHVQPQQLVGKLLDELFQPDMARQHLTAIRQVIQTGKSLSREILEMFPAGKAWLSVRLAPLRNARGEIVSVLGLSHDITARKKIEQELIRLKTAVEQAMDGFAVADLDGYIQFANLAWAKMHGYTVAELIGKHLSVFHTADQLQNEVIPFNQVAMQKGSHGGEVGHVRKDGVVFPTRMTSAVLMDPDHNPIGLVGNAHDITEQKQAEERLLASLREKELLLKEIHHRVKNNLQVVSSLLSLQSQHIRNPHDRDLFQESQNRVRMMALVHEKLYLSPDLAQINFAEYLRNVTDELMRSYKAEGVKLSLDVADIPLGIDAAIPCGLIVHELLSNALKYAFKRRTAGVAGRIELVFRPEPVDLVLLMVRDNGAGLPKDIDIAKTRTLGLKLVHTLTRQLQGRLECDRRQGTVFRIWLPRNRLNIRQGRMP